jgi:hypothetical protein
MSTLQPSRALEKTAAPEPRSRTPWAAFLLGVPMAAGILYLFYYGPLRENPLQRYVSHPVECVEVLLFCCAAAAFAGKYWRTRSERRAFRCELLPAWDGRAIPVSEASGLLANLIRLPKRLQRTLLARRIAAVLHFLCGRGSAAELDEQLRSLSDNDALALETSYSLTRFITWAIPILGFLGTVLGITGAISGVTPEKLEQDLNTVTDGLALAFDATALGLALTMVAMFLNFLVERSESAILEAVDHYADRQLAHRFERPASGGAGLGAEVRESTRVLLQAVEQLVQRQTELWSAALAEVDRRRAQAETAMEARLMAALEGALEKTLEAHTRRLAALEKQAVEGGSRAVEQVAAQARAICDAGRDQQATMSKLVQSVAVHAQSLARIQEGEKQLLQLQQTLNQNLATLAGAATFEQAVHSLTAAIHLLTSRASAVPALEVARPAPRSGVAA